MGVWLPCTKCVEVGVAAGRWQASIIDSLSEREEREGKKKHSEAVRWKGSLRTRKGKVTVVHFAGVAAPTRPQTFTLSHLHQQNVKPLKLPYST